MENRRERLPRSLGRVLLCLVPVLALAAAASPRTNVGTGLYVAAQLCLYSGGAFSILADLLARRTFNWNRLVLVLLTSVILAILAPLFASAAVAANALRDDSRIGLTTTPPKN